MSEVKCLPAGFTKWDRTTVDKGDLTLGGFLKAFKEVTGACALIRGPLES